MSDILGTLDVDAQVTSEEELLIKEMIKEKEDLTMHTRTELNRLKAFVSVDLRDANYLYLKDHVKAMEAYLSDPVQQRANSDDVHASLQAYKDAHGTWYKQTENRVYAYPIALLQAVLKIRYPNIDLGVTGPGAMGIDGQLGLKTLFQMWEKLKTEGKEFGGVVDEALLAHLLQTKAPEGKTWTLENGLLVVGEWKKELETAFGEKYTVSSAEGIGIPVHLTTVGGQSVELNSDIEAYDVLDKETSEIRRLVKHEGGWYILNKSAVEEDGSSPLDEFPPYDLATKKRIEIQETWDVDVKTVIVETSEWKRALEKAYPGAVVTKDTNLTRPITVQTSESSSISLPSGSIEAYKVEGTPPSDVLVYFIRYNGAWYAHDNTKDGTVYVPYTLPVPVEKPQNSFVKTDADADAFDDQSVETKVVSWEGKKIIEKEFPNWRVAVDADIKPGDKIELRPTAWTPVILENNIEAYLVQGAGEPVYLVRYNNAWYAYDDTITHESQQEKPNFVYVPCELKDVLVETK